MVDPAPGFGEGVVGGPSRDWRGSIGQVGEWWVSRLCLLGKRRGEQETDVCRGGDSARTRQGPRGLAP